MKQGICVNCKKEFVKRRKNQDYCGTDPCQRARKNQWQREAIKNKPGYRASQKQANRDWLDKTQDYWQEYRERTPEKTERNRILQRTRNQKRRLQNSETKALRTTVNRVDIQETSHLIAKMDATSNCNHEFFNKSWFIPLIAKMDAIKVSFSMISMSSADDSG